MSLEELTYVEKCVQADPYSKDLTGKFYDLYENVGKEGINAASNGRLKFHIEYLMLKFLNNNESWQSLNLLGKEFAHGEKYYLALLCFNESLRINPSQPDVFNECEKYGYLSVPEYIEEDQGTNDMISVIMGTYNRTQEIRESIQSVLNQTFQNFELIVINDGGSDEVENIVRSFGSSKIRYYKLDENRGHAAVLNKGIKMSKGKYISYLDDDDVYYPEHLELMFNELIRSNKKYVYSNTKFVRGDVENGKFIAKNVMYIWNTQHDKNKIILNNYISNLSVVHEKKLFSTIGLFSEDLNIVMDWELWLRASLKYEFSHLDRTTNEYRFSGKNITLTNRLLHDFYTILIRNYYMHYRGMLTLLKYYLHNDHPEPASLKYQEIKNIYDEYFKSAVALEEIINISIYYKDYELVKKALNDYFIVDARSCINYISEKRSMRMYYRILPLLPKKAFKVMQNRVLGIISR